MKKHPNEFTRRQIVRHFEARHFEADVASVENGYVIFFHRFSVIEGRQVEDPAGRVLFNEENGQWRLYWMSGKNRWHIYDRYSKLHEALDEMCSEHAAHLFAKVIPF